MTVPLILLAIPSIFARACSIGPAARATSAAPAAGSSRCSTRPTELLHHAEAAYELFGIDGVLIIASVAVGRDRHSPLHGGSSASSSRRSGAAGPGAAPVLADGRVPFLYRASLNKWWFDELNDLLFIRIGGRVAAALWWFDRSVVDGTVNGIGWLARRDRRRPAAHPDRPRPELRAGHRHRPARDGRLVLIVARPPMSLVTAIPIVTLVTFLPLVGALLVAVPRRERDARARRARARARWPGSLSLLLLVGVRRQRPAAGFQFVVETADWIPLFGIQYKVGRRRAVARCSSC